MIIDLSYPYDHSINAGVAPDYYLGKDFILTLPNVDIIINEIRKLGRGSYIFKVDISRAFRHIKIYLADSHLLGLQFNLYYIDTCLPFRY